MREERVYEFEDISVVIAQSEQKKWRKTQGHMS